MKAPSPYGRRRGMRVSIKLKVPLPNPLLTGEGISITKFTQVLNQMTRPLPMGEGWGEGNKK